MDTERKVVMKGWTLLIVGACCAIAAGSACSGTEEQSTNDGGALDAGVVAATDAASDATAMQSDGGAGQDGGSNAGGDVAADLPDLVEQPREDYRRCQRDDDCPNDNGSTCIIEVPLSDGSGSRPLSDVFSRLDPGEGVCSQDCTDDPTICTTVLWQDARGTDVPSICTVVAVGGDPYSALKLDPTDTDALNDVVSGQAFAAICAPAAKFCGECAATADCAAATTCINLRTNAPREAGESGDSVCLPSCVTGADCPLGFDCEVTGDGSTNHCLPVAGTCSACVDRDGDTFGTGSCRQGMGDDRITPYDCDDQDDRAYYDAAEVEHSFAMFCGEFDYNCDGLNDDVQQLGTASHCEGCYMECSGSVGSGMRVCEPQNDGTFACVTGCSMGFADCNADMADGCETDETSQDHLYYEDADTDGYGDLTSRAFFCDDAAAEAVMTNPVQLPVNATEAGWVDCNDASDTTYPGALEQCDGEDNNCDSYSDDDPQAAAPIIGVGVACSDAVDMTGTLLQGACAIGEQQCAPPASGPWALSCTQTVFVTTEVCDGIDSDCDGEADSVDSDVAGVNSSCNGTLGVDGSVNRCTAGSNVCPAGTGGLVCAPTISVAEDEKPGFDGDDSNCDGHDRYWDSSNGRPYAIFVTQGGTVTPTGTPTSPFGQNTLNEAMVAAAACNVTTPGGSRGCDVWMDKGSYNVPKTLVLRDGVDVYGGFDVGILWTDAKADSATPCPNGSPCAADTQLTVANNSLRNHSFLTPPLTASYQVLGVYGGDMGKPTTFAHISVTTVDADSTRAESDSNFAMAIYNATDMTLDDVQLTSGAAGKGAAGTNGAPAPDATGFQQSYDCYATANGQGVCDNSAITAKTTTTSVCGAAGGSSAVYVTGTFAKAGDGAPGLDGRGDGPMDRAPNTGQAGGIGTTGGFNTNVAYPKTAPYDQADGRGGRSAMNKATVTDDKWGSFLNWPLFIPSGAAKGYDGGGGGGGGGGGYAHELEGLYVAMATTSGPNGGCGGIGGAGGKTGGFSVALAIGHPDTVIRATTLDLTAGKGGAGGVGGEGGSGGAGQDHFLAQAGNTNSYYKPYARSFSGLAGHGAGGNGGNGGAGGASIALFRIQNAIISGVYTKTVASMEAVGGTGGTAGTQGGVMSTIACVGTPGAECKRRQAVNGQAGLEGEAGFKCGDATQDLYGVATGSCF